ncbi:MAG: hypothetical protein BJG00_002560 [Limnothrix sp. CACIAM 69d]|nr:MAG: hypothetical protein BJG00_002560 [Limnothrix sp. CACIAM 69d]
MSQFYGDRLASQGDSDHNCPHSFAPTPWADVPDRPGTACGSWVSLKGQATKSWAIHSPMTQPESRSLNLEA